MNRNALREIQILENRGDSKFVVKIAVKIADYIVLDTIVKSTIQILRIFTINFIFPNFDKKC